MQTNSSFLAVDMHTSRQPQGMSGSAVHMIVPDPTPPLGLRTGPVHNDVDDSYHQRMVTVVERKVFSVCQERENGSAGSDITNAVYAELIAICCFLLCM